MTAIVETVETPMRELSPESMAAGLESVRVSPTRQDITFARSLADLMALESLPREEPGAAG